jgi:Flp pilus assembly protein protease CpaA
MYQEWAIAILSIIWLVVCAIQDAKTGEVSNWLTLPGMAAGILFSFFIGWERVAFAGAALLATLLFFFLGSMGGADVKVLTGLAGLWPAAMIAAFIVQGLWGAVVMVRKGRGSEFRAIPSYAIGAALSVLLLI